MKPSFLMTALIAIAASSITWAQANKALDKDTQEDIAKHRTIAAAHEKAARCLESGKSHDACMQELRDSCKGVAIGKFCGMRHTH